MGWGGVCVCALNSYGAGISGYKDGTEFSCLTRFIDRLELLKSYITLVRSVCVHLVLFTRAARVVSFTPGGIITQYTLSRKLNNNKAWF